MVTETKPVRLVLGSLARTEIVIDGVDIAKQCFGVSLNAPAQEIPTLTVEVMAFGDYEIDEAQVRYHAVAWGKSGEGRTPIEAIRALLEALGG